jgi:hypothetical protein
VPDRLGWLFLYGNHSTNETVIRKINMKEVLRKKTPEPVSSTSHPIQLHLAINKKNSTQFQSQVISLYIYTKYYCTRIET